MYLFYNISSRFFKKSLANEYTKKVFYPLYVLYYIVQSLTILYHCIFYATKKIVYFIANKIHPVYENRQIENNLLYSGQICVDGFFDIIYTKNPVISFLLFNSIVYYYFLITEFTIFDVRILFF